MDYENPACSGVCGSTHIHTHTHKLLSVGFSLRLLPVHMAHGPRTANSSHSVSGKSSLFTCCCCSNEPASSSILLVFLLEEECSWPIHSFFHSSQSWKNFIPMPKSNTPEWIHLLRELYGSRGGITGSISIVAAATAAVAEYYCWK